MPFPALSADAQKLQTMGLLVGGVVHDFNNILAIIDGYAHVLDHHFGSDPLVHDKLNAIRTATQRGTALTRNLLALGGNPSPSQDAVCDIVSLLQENYPLLRSLLSSRIDIVLELPPSPVLLAHTPQETLQHIIRHCHEMKQTIQGTGRILIHLVNEQDHVLLVLTNLATGLESHYRFQRLIDRQTLQNKTVLVVDDEEALLPVLEHQLQRMGLTVLKAANADSVLLLQKDYPDVIDFLLTDIVMPDVDGVQLAEMMTDNRPRMGVVYMTGHTNPGSGIDIPDESLIVPKPLRPETLSLALQKALEQVQDA